MRRLPLVLLLAGLTGAPFIAALGAGPGDSGRAPGTHAKGVDLAGTVSNDGKTLLAEDDNAWSITNADVLRDFAGRHVTVKCRMDPGRRSIRVLYVLDPDTKRSSNLRDSAFRR